MTGRDLHWKSGGHDLDVHIEESGGHGTLRTGEQSASFIIHGPDATGGWIEINGRNERFHVYRDRDVVTVWIHGRTYRLVRAQKGRMSHTDAAAASGEVRALMPGKIVRIAVTEGDTIVEKQPLIVMESMKMETTLAAPHAGTVTAIKCKVGDVVEMGELLVNIEPRSGGSSVAPGVSPG